MSSVASAVSTQGKGLLWFVFVWLSLVLPALLLLTPGWLLLSSPESGCGLQAPSTRTRALTIVANLIIFWFPFHRLLHVVAVARGAEGSAVLLIQVVRFAQGAAVAGSHGCGCVAGHLCLHVVPHHAHRVVPAVSVPAVRAAVVVLVTLDFAVLSRGPAAVRAQRAVRVVAVGVAVSVVVDVVVAQELLVMAVSADTADAHVHAQSRSTIRVGTVDQAVLIVILTVGAILGTIGGGIPRVAEGVAPTVGVVAVDLAVSVVVREVITDLHASGARGITRALGVSAVVVAVPVVVLHIIADLRGRSGIHLGVRKRPIRDVRIHSAIRINDGAVDHRCIRSTGIIADRRIALVASAL